MNVGSGKVGPRLDGEVLMARCLFVLRSAQTKRRVREKRFSKRFSILRDRKRETDREVKQKGWFVRRLLI